MAEVQAEIVTETARSPLDPVALGFRYAEVEAIRREIAERVSRLVPENVAVLTDAQKVKLKALEEALKLASTGGEARNLRLLPEECGFYIPTGVFVGAFSPQIGIATACSPQQMWSGYFAPVP